MKLFIVKSANKYYFGPFSTREAACRFAREECSSYDPEVLDMYSITREYDSASNAEEDGSHYTFCEQS